MIKAFALSVSQIYYMFSSRLLASCGEAMTERFLLPEKLFYSVGSTTGDLWLLRSVDISFKLQNRNLLCQIARTFEQIKITTSLFIAKVAILADQVRYLTFSVDRHFHSIQTKPLGSLTTLPILRTAIKAMSDR